MSDIYNQNDNPTNPYSQFSEVGADSVYKGRSNEEVDRRKKALTAGLVRFEKTPFYIETKQAQQLKSNLIEAATLKQDMCLASSGPILLPCSACCFLHAGCACGSCAGTSNCRLYFSGAEGSPAYEAARGFNQQIGNLGVSGGQNKDWARAQQDHGLRSRAWASPCPAKPCFLSRRVCRPRG